MTHITYRIALMILMLTVVFMGRGETQPQATLSVDNPSDTNSTLRVRVKEQPGYAISGQVMTATQGKVQLKPTRDGHEGQGTIQYQVNPHDQGGKVMWNAQTNEKVEGKDAARMIQYPPFPVAFPTPMPIPQPTFPPQMKIEFPIPPAPVQPFAPVYFPPMPLPPPMPSMPALLPVPMAPPMPSMPVPPPMPVIPPFAMPQYPVIPDTARGISSSTSEGEVDYHSSKDGRSKGVSWSSKSESSTSLKWPPLSKDKSQ